MCMYSPKKTSMFLELGPKYENEVAASLKASHAKNSPSVFKLIRPDPIENFIRI